MCVDCGCVMCVGVFEVEFYVGVYVFCGLVGKLIFVDSG